MSREEYASVNADVGDKATRATLTIGRFFPQTATISAVLLGALDSAQPSTAGSGASAGTGGSPSGLDIPFRGASGGARAGKPFTKAGKNIVKAKNAEEHGGQTTCERCNQSTVPAEQSRSGVTPPTNETAVDHVIPQSKNGNGSPDNGQVLCRKCNGEKSDKL